MTFHKVSSQAEYGRKLIDEASAKLADLETEYTNMKASLEDVQFVIVLEEFVPPLQDVNPREKDLEELQRKEGFCRSSRIPSVVGRRVHLRGIICNWLMKPGHTQSRGNCCGCGTELRMSCSSAA